MTLLILKSDRQLILLQLSCILLASMAKAEKWYYVKEGIRPTALSG